MVGRHHNITNHANMEFKRWLIKKRRYCTIRLSDLIKQGAIEQIDIKVKPIVPVQEITINISPTKTEEPIKPESYNDYLKGVTSTYIPSIGDRVTIIAHQPGTICGEYEIEGTVLLREYNKATIEWDDKEITMELLDDHTITPSNTTHYEPTSHY